MTWSELDWKSLDSNRQRFLEGKPGEGPYWESEAALASYDKTFGERIGWKWDAVLLELRMRGWKPPGGCVLDWGCGSGIAGRRVARFFGETVFESMVVWDHSPIAADFACNAATAAFPSLQVSSATAGYLSSNEEVGTLLISHVLNELDPAARQELMGLIRRSRSVLWVEPGSRDASRALGRARDELVPEFGVVAPCTHANPCPVLLPENERHWCHHFAAPPPGIFADSNWVKFGQRAGIDLRSIPYSFIALEKNWKSDTAGLSRVIGRTEAFKPYVRILNCDSGGLAQLEVVKRSAPDLYKQLPKSKLPLVYRWERDGTDVVGGSALDS